MSSNIGALELDKYKLIQKEGSKHASARAVPDGTQAENQQVVMSKDWLGSTAPGA
jgi:hypothetical protein